MIASLMMYQHSAIDGALARYWGALREALRNEGIAAPVSLSNAAEEFSVWRAPDLVLSQTCGMPYRLWLHSEVNLIGTPDYGLEGCPPGHYDSAFVVRADDPRRQIEDFATSRFTYNQTFSQSGYAAPYAHTTARGFWFADRRQSHGHARSAMAVAEGRADIAAIDGVTWRILARHADFAANLRVLERTAPSPGLPYIAAQGADKVGTASAVRTAISQLSDADRTLIGLQGLIDIPAEHYLAIPNPHPDA